MRKKLLMFTAVLSATALSAQQAIIVNGGKFGDPSDNVNIISYDVQTNTYTTIDTIQTSSVQTLLIEGNIGYVAAQDSIVSYDLKTNTRIAAASFNGPSTKGMAIYNNQLLVGNYYGKSTDNLYIYDKSSLMLTDSINQITKGVSNMIVNGDSLYIAQNYTSSTYTDSAGYIAVVDLSTMSFVRDVVFNNNNEELGFLVKNSSGTGFYGINTNSIIEYNFASGSVTITPSLLRLSAGPAKSTVKGDTLFLEVNSNIGSMSLATGAIIDTDIIAYSPTSFALDTINRKFYTTATDYFSYKEGKVFDFNDHEIDTLIVGFSPEIIQIHYGNITSIISNKRELSSFSIYPNPAIDQVKVDVSEFQNNATVLVTVTDISGKLHFRKNYSTASLFNLNIEQLTSGMYLISLQSDKNVGVQKLIVE